VMEPNGPRKIQFTVPLLEPHLDPEAAEQVGIKGGGRGGGCRPHKGQRRDTAGWGGSLL
uniref:Protein phosphatase 1 regulatory subunit 1A n=1 Tax=Coturnix japonica TaxID=93934 RepID=A0A8C2YGV2_COTJA